jgi:hypothetical protein
MTVEILAYEQNVSGNEIARVKERNVKLTAKLTIQFVDVDNDTPAPMNHQIS